MEEIDIVVERRQSLWSFCGAGKAHGALWWKTRGGSDCGPGGRGEVCVRLSACLVCRYGGNWCMIHANFVNDPHILLLKMPFSDWGRRLATIRPLSRRSCGTDISLHSGCCTPRAGGVRVECISQHPLGARGEGNWWSIGACCRLWRV